MPALQIRDFLASLHRMPAERARLERGTIAQQTTVLLSEALVVAQPPRDRRQAILAEIARSRKRFDFTRVTPPEEMTGGSNPLICVLDASAEVRTAMHSGSIFQAALETADLVLAPELHGPGTRAR